MTLKEITFGFENCETMTIEGKYICGFVVDDLHTSFQRIACNAIDKIDEANTVALEIARAADGGHMPFGCQDMASTKFKRLMQYDDITSIDFVLVDENGKEEKYSYWVVWTGYRDEINESQTTYLSNLGNLYIVISDTKKFEDFFDKDLINDEEHVSVAFRMCDIPL